MTLRFMKLPVSFWRSVIAFLGVGIVAGTSAAMAQSRPMGADVSSYQGGSISWTTVRSDGISFAWTKATEGTYYTDADLAINESHASSAGVFIGAYHFARPSDDPNITGAKSADTEAQFFWSKASNYVTAGGGYLVPMLDWEDTGVSNQLTAATMSLWVNEWCNDISNYARANGVTVRPVIYTGTWYSEPSSSYPGLTTAATNWPSWISAYPTGTPGNYGSPTPQTSAPGNTFPWSTWNIWQYGDTNWSGGDSDVFNGTTNQFLSLFLVGSTNAPRITTSPLTITAAQGANVTLTVAATGGTPLYYNWELDGTIVSSVTNYNTNSVQYMINGAQLANAGNYTVQISNSSGSVVTTPAFLSVKTPLSNAAGSVLAPPGLVNWWPGNGNAIDIVSGYNGLPANGFSYAAGETGQAFHFDGSTSYLTMTNSPADMAAPWTACMWVYRQQTPQVSAALLSDGTYTLKLEQYMNKTNSHYVGITQLGVADYVFSQNYIVPLNTWTHLAFVASGSTTTLYANGVAKGTVSAAIPLGRITMGVTDVSGTGYVDYMEGSMDDVMTLNTALTATQIQAIYNSGASGLVQAPQFTGMSTDVSGNFIFSLEGLTGSRAFIVYYSTNLLDWSVLTTLSAATGVNQFAVNPTNAAAFYRAIQP